MFPNRASGLLGRRPRRATLESIEVGDKHAESLLESISPDALAGLCQGYQAQELALFGSALTDRFRPASDLDFLVTFQPQARPGFLTLTRLQRDLEALFHRKVDLVPKKGLKPAIRDSVLALRLPKAFG